MRSIIENVVIFEIFERVKIANLIVIQWNISNYQGMAKMNSSAKKIFHHLLFNIPLKWFNSPFIPGIEAVKKAVKHVTILSSASCLWGPKLFQCTAD